MELVVPPRVFIEERRRAVVKTPGQALRRERPGTREAGHAIGEIVMPLLLWLLGVPGIVVLLLWATGIIGF